VKVVVLTALPTVGLELLTQRFEVSTDGLRYQAEDAVHTEHSTLTYA
jgi:hypothetical protein